MLYCGHATFQSKQRIFRYQWLFQGLLIPVYNTYTPCWIEFLRLNSVNIKTAFHKGVRIGVKILVSTAPPEGKLERFRPAQTPSCYLVTLEGVWPFYFSENQSFIDKTVPGKLFRMIPEYGTWKFCMLHKHFSQTITFCF